MNENLLEQIAAADLRDLAKVFAILAEKVTNYRKENESCVPPEIFTFCLAIGGIYPCVEIIAEVVDKNKNHLGYVLKKRDGVQEQGWRDQYQIPGTAGKPNDDPPKIFSRLAEEIFGKYRPMKLEFLGCEIHDEEPERLAACWTLVYRIKINPAAVKQLSGTWKIFTNINDPNIIFHHRSTLRWADDPTRLLFADLR